MCKLGNLKAKASAVVSSEVQGAMSELGERPWWSYRLPAELEVAFEAQSAAARAAQLRVWGWVTLAFVWSSTPLDYRSMPHMWPLFVSLRLLVVTPLFLLSMRRLGVPRSRWATVLLTTGPYCSVLATMPVIFAAGPTIDTTVTVLVQFVNTLWITALVPLGMTGTLVFCAFSVVASDGIIAAAFEAHHTAFARPDIAIACHLMILLMLLGKMLTERESRRSFVAGLRLQVQADSLARSNAQLLEMSHTDALTGLANRRAFDQTLDRALTQAAKAGTSVALLMIDIDHFKQFNDTAGHAEGDRCLATVAQAIAREIRPADLAARYGGEEFVVIMAGADLTQAASLAERIRAAISVLRVYHPGLGGGQFVSISIGLAAVRPDGSAAACTSLIVAADRALYRAKHAGRDRVMVAEPAEGLPQPQHSAG